MHDAEQAAQEDARRLLVAFSTNHPEALGWSARKGWTGRSPRPAPTRSRLAQVGSAAIAR
jgi:hypothetical protein